jgi:hypothetical protein
MRRRHWLGALGGAAGACLFAGCLGGPAHRAVSHDFNAPVPDDAQAAGPPGALSTYHARLLAADGRGGKTPEEVLARVRLDVKAPEPPPPPPELKPAAAVTPAPAPLPPPEAPLVAALRCVLEKHPAEAVSLLQRYDKADQELLLALLPLAARIGEGELERISPEEMAAILDRLHALILALRPRAALTLDKTCFCRQIDNFGRYEPLPPDHLFQAGGADRPGEFVQVYVEVKNVTSRPRGPFYETALSSTLEIFNAQKERVWLCRPAAVERSQSPRQDYFINFQFAVPRLPQGLYTLRITVRDDAAPAGGRTPRTASCSLDFQVAVGAAVRGQAPEDGDETPRATLGQRAAGGFAPAR